MIARSVPISDASGRRGGLALLLIGLLGLPSFALAQEPRTKAADSPPSQGALHLKINEPAEAFVDQPITFQVEVRNDGKETTDKDLSLVVLFGNTGGIDLKKLRESPGSEVDVNLPLKTFKSNVQSVTTHYLWAASIEPGEMRKLGITATPKRARTLSMAVLQAAWDPGSSKDGACPPSFKPISNFAAAEVKVQYTPLEGFLPQPPDRGHLVRSSASLPQTLAEVPEVFFQEPLSKKTDSLLHTLRVVDRIEHLNGKQPDGFLKGLLGMRPDLAGLPFVMGDACRMKADQSRQFVAALDTIRSSHPLNSRGEFVVPKLEENSEWMRGYRIHEEFRWLTQKKKATHDTRVAALMQVFGPEAIADRHELAQYLSDEPEVAATRALARLAIFSEEATVRDEAVRGLKLRRDRDYTDILVAGLSYPWPAVAQRSSEAIVKLGRTDLIPRLIDVLAQPDPRSPQVREAEGQKSTIVREVVRINHLRNCLLCHAPARPDAAMPKEQKDHFDKLTAQVPLPGESITAYYRPSNPDILVRLDVTYLRHDFSLNLRVNDADPWPEMQRYDFLVRTREVNEQEAAAIQRDLRAVSPYRTAAQTALCRLTGRDAQPTATAWNRVLGK